MKRESKMFTRKLSKQAKLMMLFVFVPLYFFCGSIIATALIKFCVIQFSLVIDETTAVAYLNLILDSIYAIIILCIFKDSLKEQFQDFLKDKKENLLYGCVIGFVMLFAAGIIGGLISMSFGAQSDSQNQILIENLAIAHPIIIVITSVILSPIVEELLFRSTLFGWLYEIHPIVAHFGSAFLFGFVHVMDAILSGNYQEWTQIFAYFLMGGVLSFIYEKRNNIYVPILSHMMNNLISILLVLFG